MGKVREFKTPPKWDGKLADGRTVLDGKTFTCSCGATVPQVLTLVSEKVADAGIAKEFAYQCQSCKRNW